MNFIAIENASNGASVALLCNDNNVPRLFYRASQEEGKNAEQVLPMLDKLLVEAGLTKQDIHAVAFSQGPGGFTGLRVASGLAQGLALGLGIPVIPVSSLEASAVLSLRHVQDGLMVVALDARMEEVYLAVYEVKQGKLNRQPILAPMLIQANDVIDWVCQQIPRWCLLLGYNPHEPHICLAGNAVTAYAQAFTLPNEQWCLGEVGWGNADTLVNIAYECVQKEGKKVLINPVEQPDALAPLYLRDKVAFTTVERESGLGGNPHIALPILTEKEQSLSALAQELLAKQIWIRPLKRSDLPAVMAIEEKAHYHPWSEGMFFAAFMHVNYHNWALVDEHNQILAYAIQLVEPDVVNLMTIAVAPALQGQGLGKILLRWLELFITTHPEIPQQQLLEVRVSNHAAKALYMGMGYEQIGLRKGYYPCEQGREDALVLQKVIA